MKKILASLTVLGLMCLTLTVGTRAYFTDTETSQNNTFTTGTLDIAVDGQNPWARTAPYTLTDMKPGYVDYLNFTVQNVGTNPANVWKNITVTNHENAPVSEPECIAEGGTYNVDGCSGNTPKDDLENVILYDLKVKLYNAQGVMAWEQMIYNEDITLARAYANGQLYLGMIPAGWHMDVEQSYRMDPTAGNEYQGDAITFDITLTAEQLKNTVRLEDKNTTTWELLHDARYADVTYGVKESTFDYTVAATGMTDGAYTLVAWEDPTNLWAWGNFAGTTVLANVNVVGGVANKTGSVELNKNLTNSKLWLVPGNLGAPGATGVSLPWNPGSTLFETGLISYMDADL